MEYVIGNDWEKLMFQYPDVITRVAQVVEVVLQRDDHSQFSMQILKNVDQVPAS